MTRPVLDIRGVSKSFGGLRAVDRFSFAVAEGQIAAVIGPNGAGKTTLFNLISGFLQPDAGAILLDGADVARRPPHAIAARGLIRTFQLVRLFPDMTVAENVMVGFHLRSRGGLLAALTRLPAVRRQEHRLAAEAQALLDFVGLADRAAMPARHLTYGQQRLLEIARALAGHPRILLLDEPAAGLNPAEAMVLARLLRDIRGRGTTILFIEHDMNVVMGTAETIAVLDFGRKIAEGVPEAVQRHPAVLEAYLGGTEAEPARV